MIIFEFLLEFLAEVMVNLFLEVVLRGIGWTISKVWNMACKTWDWIRYLVRA